jgi:cytochrome c-type biogenesis protein CcmH
MRNRVEKRSRLRRTSRPAGYTAVGKRVAVLLGVVLLFAAAPARALSEQNALSAEQEARARAIEDQLIAPCCFSQTVANHHSPVAESIKAQVREMLAAGSSEREIVDFFVGKYGERILAAPRVSGFNVLAYVVPVLALGSGLAGVVMLLRRWRRPRFPRQAGAPRSLAVSSEEARRFQTRLEEELARFDG